LIDDGYHRCVSVDDPKPPAAIPGARLHFSLDPAVTHLNHGSFGSVPIGVQRAQQRLRDEMESNPQRFFTVGLGDRIAHARRHLATFLGADPDGSALVANATTGVAVVLNSISPRAGDEIMLTDHAYGAVRIAVEDVCRRTGATVRTVQVPLAATDEEVVAALGHGVRPGRTRLAIVDQIASATARLFPVAAIAARLREADVPVFVDAAHVPGMLPVRVAAVGADFWVGNLHKWGYAPRGTALLSVARHWRDRIEPLVISWERELGFPADVEWQGTQDVSAWLAAPIGVYTLRTLGLAEVRAHNAALAAYGQRMLGDALGVAPADLPDPGGADVSMRVVPLPAGIASTSDEAVGLRRLIAERLATEVSVHAWHGRGLLRLSGQIYNRAEEYERFAERLPRLLADLR
jgi:isopenicillin-N epimerase